MLCKILSGLIRQQQKQKQQQQQEQQHPAAASAATATDSKTYKQPVWQAAGLTGLLFKYFLIFFNKRLIRPIKQQQQQQQQQQQKQQQQQQQQKYLFFDPIKPRKAL